MPKEFTQEELEVIKRLIQEGEASPSQIMQFGYLIQEPKRVDKTKFKEEQK